MSDRRIVDLEDVKQWIAQHDGRIDAWWAEQHRWNARAEHQMERVSSRLSSVERRVIWLTSLAAAGGGAAGQIVATVLGGM